MPLETSTTIDGLNALWPLGTDTKSQGDDHLRLLKSVLQADAVDQAQFATLSGSTVKATAQARNRIANPAMQISQENINTAGTVNAYHAADQWFTGFVSSAGTITSQRVQSVTPNGSKDRYRVTITVADAALAAGEYLVIQQNIEGGRVADFRYGSASAKQAILRFGLKAPAGTYAVSLKNSGTSRSYVALVTVSAANTDTEYSLVIPGDTAGTWLTDSGIGISLTITLACGTTFQGAAGWQAGNVHGTSGVSNGMGTAGAVFEFYDVGLYLDPDVTGLAPKWTLPDETQELAACQRYWQWVAFQYWGAANSGVAYLAMGKISPSMRTTPAMGGAIQITATLFPAVAGGFSVFNFLGGGVSENRTASGTGTGGFQTVAAANARM